MLEGLKDSFGILPIVGPEALTPFLESTPPYMRATVQAVYRQREIWSVAPPSGRNKNANEYPPWSALIATLGRTALQM